MAAMDSRGSRIAALRYSLDLDPRARWAGRVLSVHRSALNVSVGDGLLVVAGARGGALPGSIIVADDFDPIVAGVRTGMLARLDRDLWVGSAVAISLAAARPWSPTLPVIRAGRDIGRRLAVLGGALSRQGTSGFAGLASGAAELAAFSTAAGGDVTAIAREGDRLVGLGAGLTPAGDDLLVGFSAAFTAYGHPAARPLAGRWAEQAATATTVVATAYHRHAAAGRYAERLHDLLAAILGGPPDGISAAVERACRFGATSGVDLVTGVELGLRAARNAQVERAA